MDKQELAGSPDCPRLLFYSFPSYFLVFISYFPVECLATFLLLYMALSSFNSWRWQRVKTLRKFQQHRCKSLLSTKYDQIGELPKRPKSLEGLSQET